MSKIINGVASEYDMSISSWVDPTIKQLQQENQRLKEQIRIRDEHPIISKFYADEICFGKTKHELQKRIDNAIKYMENYIEVEDLEPVIVEFGEVIKILKGVEVIFFNQERYFTFEVDDIEGSDNNE